ncbi:MAG: beta-ketoacyl synthase N-terminal-like domain-containing protein, partial [Acetobacteraceae bacterium]
MITYAQKLQSLRPAAASDEAAPTPSPTLALAPLGDGRLQARVLGLLADTLGVPAASVTPETPFAELGMGSLLGVRFLDAVNRAFGLRLGVDVLFAHSTAAALAAHIDRLAPAPAIGAAPVPEPQPASTVQPAAGDIAVIGMAGRFATAPDLAAFWQALTEGRCLVREVPPDRWSAAAFHDPDPAAIGRSVSKWAGFIDGIDRFDAGFFKISPREAAAMDPQHRLFLEQAWLALEDAGYAPDRLKGSATGVYVGGSGSGYETMLAPDAKAAQSYGLTGNLVSLLASRIAYFLDLRGPALVVDTACSASLVALDLACQALQRGEIDMALVGGVSLFLDEKPFVAMTRTGMLSPDGRCRTFDADANGIAVGEAAAAVVLKPLARALADGDRVDAVIKASGTNQDGRSNGITAPNPEAQAALLRAVQARAGIDPATITYAEAHGTGTPLGDPIEVAALRTALGVRPADMPPCALGAVKSNIGHTAEAAGLAGLIKTVLCLKHGELVPSVNFATLNPKIDLSDVPLAVETRHRPWTTAPGTPRRACVSAFGLSGTNAHVVLEQAPAQPPPRAVATDEPQLLLISARDAQALERRVSDLAAWLRDTAEPLADVAATLALGRGHFEHRAALIANSTAEAASLLAAGRQRTAVLRRGDAPNVAPNGPTLEQRAAAYLAGAVPDWPELWSGARRNLSLPGYPFTRAEHWAARRPVAAPVAHPFADAREASGIARRFTPADPVARDHVIGGVPLIHAAIFLEMARLAAEASGGAPVGALRDIAWNRTVPVPPDGVRVAIGTETSPQGLTCVMRAGEETAPVATCIAVVSAAAAMPAPIAAAVLQDAATQHATRAELDALDRGSVRLGPSFAGFDELWVGDEAALSWVGAVPDDGCVLSPRLMDAAIQTGAALLARGDGPQFRLRYPAGVAEIALLRPIPRDGCFIRATRAGADRVDLTIAGPDGQPVLHWTRFELRPAGADRAEPRQEVAPQTFRPAWVKHSGDDGPLTPPHAVVGDAATLAWLAGAWPAGVAQTAAAEDMAALDRIAASVPADGRILFAAFEDDATPGLLRLTKALAARGLDGSAIDLRVLTACAHTVTGQETLVPVVAPIQGLAKAIGREFPSWRVTVLDLPATELTPATRDAVLRATAPATGEPLAWRDGAWFERRLEPIEAVAAGTILRPGGAYLLIGGMGRVGREIARHLARTHRARLTLVGRAALDADRKAFLDELAALGAEAVYHPADITQPGALRPVVALARQRFGALHGAVHAVVDPLFARLAQTTEDAFAAALRPKVDGLRELAAAIADQPLDFLAIFSSIGAYAGFPGNVGQASYCAACCFEDSFAAALHADGRPVRLIQWGLWEHEAFQGEGLRRLQRQGTYPMRTDAAVAAFERIVAGQAAHVVHASLSSAVWQGMGAVVPGEGADAAIAAMRVIAQGAAKSDPTLHVAVDAYARVLTRDMLQERGLLAAGEAPGILRHRLPVLPRHDRLFNAVLALLAHDEGAAPTRDALLARAPSVREPLELLELCVAALPDVLSGERQGTDVMFPGGSMRLVEAIYRNQPVLAACNAMVAAAVAAARPTRILEIGAGTGATADAVLAALPPAPGAEYHFTDISPGFVRHAKQRIADPRARFAVLDIEQDPLAQGMAAGSFDLVLATNVLHATRDMAETLDHIAALLRPGGLLVVNEMAVAEDFATLTFGLLEGWWRATDTPNRLPHSPLLSVDLWRRALHRAGFAPVEATAAPGFPEAASCPQVVLLASKVNAEAAKPAVASAPPVVPAARSAVPATASDVEAMVRDRVAAGLDLPAAAIDLETPFGELG